MLKTRISVVNIALLFLLNLLEIYLNLNMLTIILIIKAFKRREYIVIKRSRYKTLKIRDKLPIIDALKLLKLIARLENIIIRVIKSLK
jgi:hypothetical protein